MDVFTICDDGDEVNDGHIDSNNNNTSQFPLIGKRMHIILMGDSVLDNGQFLSDKGQSVASCLRSLLQERLGDGHKVTLLARSGSYIKDVANQTNGIPKDATHIIISAGGNDTIVAGNKFMSLKVFDTYQWIKDDLKMEYENLLNKVFKKIQKPTCILTLYLPRSISERPGAAQKILCSIGLNKVNDVIKESADEYNCGLIDTSHIMKEKGDFTHNGVEPSGAAAKKLCEKILEFCLISNVKKEKVEKTKENHNNNIADVITDDDHLEKDERKTDRTIEEEGLDEITNDLKKIIKTPLRHIKNFGLALIGLTGFDESDQSNDQTHDPNEIDEESEGEEEDEEEEDTYSLNEFNNDNNVEGGKENGQEEPWTSLSDKIKQHLSSSNNSNETDEDNNCSDSATPLPCTPVNHGLKNEFGSDPVLWHGYETSSVGSNNTHSDNEEEGEEEEKEKEGADFDLFKFEFGDECGSMRISGHDESSSLLGDYD